MGKFYGKDIREHGSKGAGLTNTIRVLGKKAGIFVLLGDVLKGLLACAIGLLLGVYLDSPDCVSLLAAGLGAVTGHNWPLYFGFRGGRGVLTAVSVLLVADWAMALICLGAFIIIVAVFRYVSLGSICAATLFAALSVVSLFGHGLYFYIFACLIAAMIIFRHRGNIKRLIAGTENKFMAKNKGKSEHAV